MPLRTIFRLRLRSWSVSLKARAHYSSPSSIDRWLGFTRYTTRDATQFRDAIYLILSLSILSPPTQRHDLAPLTTTQRHDLAPRTLPQSAPPLYYYYITVLNKHNTARGDWSGHSSTAGVATAWTAVASDGARHVAQSVGVASADRLPAIPRVFVATHGRWRAEPTPHFAAYDRTKQSAIVRRCPPTMDSTACQCNA